MSLTFEEVWKIIKNRQGETFRMPNGTSYTYGIRGDVFIPIVNGNPKNWRRMPSIKDARWYFDNRRKGNGKWDNFGIYGEWYIKPVMDSLGIFADLSEVEALEPQRNPTDPKSLSDIIQSLRAEYGSALHEKALLISTPASEKRSLDGLDLSLEATTFIRDYLGLTKEAETLLYTHQYKTLMKYLNGDENFILTSATGSGKSLAFWTWVIDCLAKHPEATAMVCYPTQALMWGQAKRLEAISRIDQQDKYGEDSALAGRLSLGDWSTDWTIWKGITHDNNMRAHEKSSSFKQARIRLATLDKAHWSLLNLKSRDFLSKLSNIVIDEAHQYSGVFGANVQNFIRRVYAFKESKNEKRPGIFLASATLPDSTKFASTLISQEEDAITHIDDGSSNGEMTMMPIDLAQERINNPDKNSFMKVVIFADSTKQSKGKTLSALLNNDGIWGDGKNTIYFAYSKKECNELRRQIAGHNRQIEVYHADMPEQARRDTEVKLNQDGISGVTLLATSAMELGVDIKGLDVCLMDMIPEQRIDLVQRIGRVGRSTDTPGLVVLRVGSDPADQKLLAFADVELSPASFRRVPIPQNIELVKLRHKAALSSELHECTTAYEEYFGSWKTSDEIGQDLSDQFGNLVDCSDSNWYYQGFRGGISSGKIKLKSSKYNVVAQIDKWNLFRDAHPEAIYIDHLGKHWEVTGYYPDLDPKTHGDLLDYYNHIKSINVKPSHDGFTTKPDVDKQPPKMVAPIAIPDSGEEEFGLWKVSSTFCGYRKKGSQSGQVTSAELRDKKLSNVFSHPLSYLTYGWKWHFASDDICHLEGQQLGVLQKLILHFLAEAVQTNPIELEVTIDKSDKNLIVMDNAPGGNGVSEALLKENMVRQSFAEFLGLLKDCQEKHDDSAFRDFVESHCNEETDLKPGELIPIIESLCNQWEGSN